MTLNHKTGLTITPVSDVFGFDVPCYDGTPYAVITSPLGQSKVTPQLLKQINIHMAAKKAIWIFIYIKTKCTFYTIQIFQ